jgi:hypothetical protein
MYEKKSVHFREAEFRGSPFLWHFATSEAIMIAVLTNNWKKKIDFPGMSS